MCVRRMVSSPFDRTFGMFRYLGVVGWQCTLTISIFHWSRSKTQTIREHMRVRCRWNGCAMRCARGIRITGYYRSCIITREAGHTAFFCRFLAEVLPKEGRDVDCREITEPQLHRRCLRSRQETTVQHDLEKCAYW